MEWKEVRLGDVIEYQSGGTPSKQNPEYWNGNIPWISAKSMYVDFVSTSDLFITDKGLKNGSKLASVGTVLLLTRGSGLYNTIPICKVISPVAFNQDVKCLYSKNENILLNDFLFYWLLGNKTTISNILETTGIGAGKIDTTRFLSLSILLPTIENQHRLINIASSILNKIELNNKINAQLEEMAQTLFKHWFVDFGPFKDGKFVESELGMIPEGWRVGTLSEIATFKAGGDKPQLVSNTKTEECPYPIYSNGITDEGLYGYSNKYTIKEESVTVSARGTIGFVCLREEPYTPIVRLISLIPTDKCAPKFLFHLVKNCHIDGNGSTQQQLTVPNFKKTKILIPSLSSINRFEKLTESLFAVRKKNNLENLHLAQLRDTLLSKLMSGEIEL